jgi:putative MATE family efflux protein
MERQIPLEQVRENPTRVVWALAWPVVALHSFQVLNTMLDTFFIGHLKTAALTAQGAASTLLFLMIALSWALNASATALVSRPYGAEDISRYRKAARQVISVAIFGGLGLVALIFLLNPLFSRFMVPSGDFLAREYMVRYLGYCALGIPAFFLIETLAGALAAVGDTKSPMYISGFQIFLHIALNLVLILPQTTWESGLGSFTTPGFGWGIDGAGMAYAISAWAAALLYMVWTERTKIGNCWKIQAPEAEWVGKIIKIGGPATLTWVVRFLMYVAFTKILALLPDGSEAIAAMRVGFSIEGIAFLPSVGLGVAAAALVGQSLGKGDPKRAERLGWLAGHHAALMTGILALVLYFFAREFAFLIVPNKPELQLAIISYVVMMTYTEVFFAYAIVLMAGMQGAGDTVRPLWITIICSVLLRLPLTWLLAQPLGFGSNGCWAAMSLTQGTQGLAMLYVFKQGRWKSKKV